VTHFPISKDPVKYVLILKKRLSGMRRWSGDEGGGEILGDIKALRKDKWY
jgi:hypothetical protein